MAYAPLSQGFLTGQVKSFEDFPADDWRRLSPRFQPDVFDENMKLVNEVKKIADSKGVTVSACNKLYYREIFAKLSKPAQVAIGWVSSLSQLPGMPQIIPLAGATTVARVEENSKQVLLNSEEMKAIDRILANFPIQGHRWPEILRPFGDI